MQTVAKRLGGLSVSDVIKRPGDRFVLYLRPFDTDEVIPPKPPLPLFSKLVSFRPFPVRIEEKLFDVADGYRPLIAVGKPGGYNQTSGAWRIEITSMIRSGKTTCTIRSAVRIAS
jgi:hypothetical protein